jgi:SAM-dependent methyltransferase
VPDSGWFNELAAHLGPAYWAPNTTRVQAFTTGTDQEVAFLVDALGLAPGQRVLDAGCGPGRHALALARRGIDVIGVDLSPDFIWLAQGAAVAEALNSRARFEVADVRALNYDAEFDAVICLCQGGFGLLGGGDDEGAALAGFAAALRPGGRLALSAFNAYFALRHLEAGDTFDAAHGVNHERAALPGADGTTRDFDLWTTCFTPRELALLARASGLVVDAVHGVGPGRYADAPPSIDQPEHLLLARRP